MKKKIFLSLFAVFLIFSAGAVIVTLYIKNTTASLSSLLKLHEIEHLRQDLVINIQTVQSDLYTVRTPLAQNLDSIIKNVTSLDNAINNCSSCHHSTEITNKIEQIQSLCDEYKNELSFYITASANMERIDKLKMDAAEVGNRLLSLTQEMTFNASNRLQQMTSEALIKIEDAKIILFATLILSSLLIISVSAYLIRFITRPVSELLNATRMIASGKLGFTIDYQDSTEFGELARNFNTMSVALKESYDSLHEQQQQIAESERKFRTLSEFAYDWEYWINEKKEIIFMSPSSERITGYKPEEFIENPRLINEILHIEDADTYRKHLASFDGPQHETMEFRIITKDSGTKWISHICSPIFTGDKFLGRRVSNRDITDTKRLEEQLIQSQKMESLGLLAGGISHGFNNLLTVIIGYTNLLEKELEGGNERIKRFIGEVLSASERAQNLTSSLLAFSHKQIIRPQRINPNDVIKNISKLLENIIGTDIELIVNCSDSDFLIFADPHQLEQVIINLVTNARDAMPNGGRLAIGTTPVILNAEYTSKFNSKPGLYVMLFASDAGSGIESKALPHIFEPFFTTKEDKGTGLGLAIVYGTVKQHGGFIDVYTEKGWGTTFKIYLPVLEEFKGKAYDEPGLSKFQADFKGNETILITEDESSVKGFLKDVLEVYGYKVILANDGLEAVKKYNDNKGSIDMVILDVVLPRKNGKEVYDDIKSVDPEAKILFVSGYTQDILTSKGIYEEGLDFIPKPLHMRNLMLKIRSILDRQ
ncbi:MAG: response regulator [Candidatus Schekmanbacteria bacterium]|nr:response regulator [Candidatus Schekmanbacteria bacterium]